MTARDDGDDDVGWWNVRQMTNETNASYPFDPQVMVVSLGRSAHLFDSDIISNTVFQGKKKRNIGFGKNGHKRFSRRRSGVLPAARS